MMFKRANPTDKLFTKQFKSAVKRRDYVAANKMLDDATGDQVTAVRVWGIKKKLIPAFDTHAAQLREWIDDPKKFNKGNMEDILRLVPKNQMKRLAEDSMMAMIEHTIKNHPEKLQDVQDGFGEMMNLINGKPQKKEEEPSPTIH